MITIHNPHLGPLWIPNPPHSYVVTTNIFHVRGTNYPSSDFFVIPVDSNAIDDTSDFRIRGSLRQLGPYPFGGNAVENIQVVGDIYPKGCRKFENDWILDLSYVQTYVIPLYGIVTYPGSRIITDSRPGSRTKYDGRCCWGRVDKGSYVFTAFFTHGYVTTVTRQMTVRVWVFDMSTHRFESRTLRVNIPGVLVYEGTVEDYWKPGFDALEAYADSYVSSPYNNLRLLQNENTLDFSEYRLRRRIVQFYRDFHDKFPWQEIWEAKESEVAKEVITGQKVTDVNVLNWIDKITSWGGGVQAILAIADDFSNPKAWASAYLSNRFGDRLEYKSSLDLLDAVWDYFLTVPFPSKYNGFRISRYQSSENYLGGQVRYASRLVCHNESISTVMNLIKGLMDWGAWPSLVNMYDLVPFSFVLDWTTSFSTLLSNVDAMVYRLYLKVALYERSISYSKKLDQLLETSGAESDLFIKYYRRWADTTCPEIKPLEGWDPEAPSLVNLVDGVALLAQLR